MLGFPYYRVIPILSEVMPVASGSTKIFANVPDARCKLIEVTIYSGTLYYTTDGSAASPSNGHAVGPTILGVPAQFWVWKTEALKINGYLSGSAYTTYNDVELGGATS